jgi:hypothetical protein
VADLVNKKLLLSIFALIIVVSITILYNVSTETSSDTIIDGDNSFSTEDLLNEIDENLLDGEDEIVIGDMI